MNISLRSVFSGRVQGVGFRWTTRQLAGSFAVGGFVRNLADGRVEVLAEGERQEVQRFLAAIGQAMETQIQSRVDHETPLQREALTNFEIRH